MAVASGLLGFEFEGHAAEADQVSVTQLSDRHGPAVDRGAVGRRQVLEGVHPGARDVELSMLG